MANNFRSMLRLRIERGLVLTPSIALKCDSKKTFAAAAFSTVVMDGRDNIGESWRGNTNHWQFSCSTDGSYIGEPPVEM
jgi:hypothetical protein